METFERLFTNLKRNHEIGAIGKHCIFLSRNFLQAKFASCFDSNPKMRERYKFVPVGGVLMVLSRALNK